MSVNAKPTGRLGILVGGGPAPGINGVIEAAAIEAIHNSLEVLGFYDGYRWISRGDTSHVQPLTPECVEGIRYRGGSVLRTSRENPTTDPTRMANVVQSLQRLGVEYLVTIGGEDTGFSALKTCQEAHGAIQVAHVPKTIDNDLPLPGNAPTFGFQTAREVGGQLVRNLVEDARTTRRWYVVTAMGRTAGHLALGMGSVGGATLTIIPEEFPPNRATLGLVCDIIEGAVIKAKALGRDYGVALVAEGVAELLADELLAQPLVAAERCEHGHLRLCVMNLAIRGIAGNIAWNAEGAFHSDAHKDLKADFVLANPPFNDSDWGGERLREDVRWKFGAPPASNANFAWVQHFVHHLAPGGTAGFVLANGSMSSNRSGEGNIRRAIIEADLVDCIVALPGQLFYTTQIPVCLWFLARNKGNSRFRDRRRQTLFIDARKLGHLVDRTHRDLADADIERIASTYHAWRGGKGAGKYKDVPGFCKSATTEEIASHGYVLTPGRYVGAEEVEDDGESFPEKMQCLTATLAEQFVESARLEKAIRASLKGIGYGG